MSCKFGLGWRVGHKRSPSQSTKGWGQFYVAGAQTNPVAFNYFGESCCKC